MNTAENLPESMVTDAEKDAYYAGTLTLFAAPPQAFDFEPDLYVSDGETDYWDGLYEDRNYGF